MSQGQQYRTLNVGEIIQVGDQFFTGDHTWVEYTADRWGTSISQYAIGRRPVLVVDQHVEYRSIETGEIIQDGDQFLYDGEWVTYQQHRWGSPFNCATQARRPIVKNGQGEQAGEEPEQPADESSSTLAARLQEALDDAICCNMNLQAERDKLQAELTALQREINQHRETNRRLDEVCGERNALQEQLKGVCFDRNVLEEQLRARRSEISANDILEFLSFQVAVIPYMQSAVGKDAQRELTLVGRTLQMVGKAIESDRIGRGRDGESAEDGEGVNVGKD